MPSRPTPQNQKSVPAKVKAEHKEELKDVVPLDPGAPRAGLEVDAAAAGGGDGVVLQRHALDVAVDEHADAARVAERGALDHDVRQTVLVLGALGQGAEPVSGHAQRVQEARHRAVAHGDVVERHVDRRAHEDPPTTGTRRALDQRALAIERDVGRADVEPGGVGARRVEVRRHRDLDPLTGPVAPDEHRARRRRRRFAGGGGRGEGGDGDDDGGAAARQLEAPHGIHGATPPAAGRPRLRAGRPVSAGESVQASQCRRQVWAAPSRRVCTRRVASAAQAGSRWRTPTAQAVTHSSYTAW